MGKKTKGEYLIVKDYIVITGGTGFVGSNLIKQMVYKTKFQIISIDNYTTGKKKNHIKDKRVRYINNHTKNIFKILQPYKNKIKTIFHFGEFARIYQSFSHINDCIDSNTIGTQAVFNYCLKNKVKLIYSATSASLGNKGKDQNLSPYAFTKAKNLEILENFKRWFNLKYEIVYFYNLYGPGQICTGNMATVIGIFENQYKNKKPLTVVKPGSQSRKFTHINDTIDACFFAWKKNKCRHYSISYKKDYTVLEVAKMFNSKIKFLPARAGERNTSSLISMKLSNKIFKIFGKINLKSYIKSVMESNKI